MISGKRTRAEHGVLSMNTLFVKVLGSMKDGESYKKII